MKKAILFFLLPIFIFLSLTAQAEKKTLHFAYFEAGDYYLNKAFSREFKDQLNLIKPDSIEIVFEPYGYTTAEWDRQRCKVMARDLTRMKKIDMVLAVGPWVVEDLIAAGFDKPIIALNQYAVWERGLVDRSGRPVADNLTINVQPLQIDNDLKLLGKLFSPKKIGLFYFPSGDEYEKVKSRAEQVAAQFGAKIVAPFDTAANGNFSHFGAYSRVVHEIDALYLPPMYSMQLDQMNQFVENCRYDRVPTLTSEGLLIVEKGITASRQQRSYVQLARFAAYKTLRIIDGAIPADLPTIYQPPEQLCLNEETLNRLNLDLPRKFTKNAYIVAAPPSDTLTVYSLSQAIDQVLQNNFGHQALLRQFDQAAASAKQAYSQYMPDLEINAGLAAADEKHPAALYNPILNRKSYAGVNFDQPLFSYSALKSIAAAKKNVELAGLNAEKEKLNLKQAVVSAYLAVLASEDKYKQLDEMTNIVRRYRDNAGLDNFVSKKDTTDVEFFDAYFIDLKLQSRRARADRDVARILLSHLLNRPDQTNMILDRKEFDTDVMVQIAYKYDSYIADTRMRRALGNYFVDAAVNNSIGIKQYALRIDSNKDLLAANKGWYWPDISLRAGLSVGEQFYYDPEDPHTIASVGGLLSWPLQLWGRNRGEGRILHYGLESLQYAKDSLRLAKATDVTTKLQAFLAYLDILPSVYDYRRTLKTGLDDYYMHYSEGKISAFDMTQVLDKYIPSEVGTVESMYDFYQAYNDLLGAAGTGYLIHGSDSEKEFYLGLEKSLGLR